MIYCENCKHFKPWTFSWEGAAGRDECKHPENLLKVSSPITSWISCIKEPEYLNRNNDCRRYKRSWWRFWA